MKNLFAVAKAARTAATVLPVRFVAICATFASEHKRAAEQCRSFAFFLQGKAAFLRLTEYGCMDILGAV